MKTSQHHDSVSRAYAEALARREAGGSGCCSPSACAAPTPGVDAPSFGCGNPLPEGELRPGMSVLDLGSGAGHDMIAAARMVGPTGRVIGVDMTGEMLESARRNLSQAGVVNAELRQGLIEALPVPDASVDYVISNCVINLSPDKAAVFRELARVLKPGGRFSISDIVAEDLPSVLLESAAAHAACIGGAIPERDYLAGLRAAGLSEVEAAERFAYDADALIGLAEGDFESLGLPAAELRALAAAAAGKVASVRFTGGKAA